MNEPNVNKLVEALLRERDQINDRIRVLEKQTLTMGFFENSMHRKARQDARALLGTFDAVFPLVLALAGRSMEEIRAQYPDAVFLPSSGGSVLALSEYIGSRVETLLRAVGPFQDVYFGRGRDGQTLVGFKPYPGGNLFMFGQQLRFPDLCAYFGPEDEVRKLAARFRMVPFDLPLPLAAPDRDVLLRVEGPLDSPNYNPRYIADHIRRYLWSSTSPDSVQDGFIQLTDPEVAKAVAKPLIFTPCWEDNPTHPGEVDWPAALIDVGSWRAVPDDHPEQARGL